MASAMATLCQRRAKLDEKPRVAVDDTDAVFEVTVLAQERA